MQVSGEGREQPHSTTRRKEVRGPGGKGFGPGREAAKVLTYKRFAESIRKQLAKLQAAPGAPPAAGVAEPVTEPVTADTAPAAVPAAPTQAESRAKLVKELEDAKAGLEVVRGFVPTARIREHEKILAAHCSLDRFYAVPPEPPPTTSNTRT